MNPLDIRTILIGFVASDAVCTLVITSLWLQHRRQSPELWLWTADFAIQTVAMLLLALRGLVPDVLSMVGGNMLGIAGTMLLFIGLERYLDRRGPQAHNWVMLAVFTAIHTYFAIVRPILAVRNINLSAALLFICVQCAWLLLRRVEPRLRPAARFAGAVFIVYALIGGVRIVQSAITTTGNDFLRSGLFDALVLLSYQMLFISLTLSLFLMVNRRLSGALQEDIARREAAEEELRRSEEKFALAFQGNPDAITLTSIEDGAIFDVNESFTRIAGYSRDEAIGRTTVDLNLWGNPADRATFVELLRSQGHPRSVEMTFRRKSGELFTGQISGEVLRLERGACVLSIIQDITERKQAETSLQEARTVAEKYLSVAAEVILGLDAQGNVTLLNDSGHRTLGYAPGELVGKNWFDTCVPEEAKVELRGVFAKLMAGEYSDVLIYDSAAITRNGTELSLLWHNTLLRDADGHIVGALSSAEDITERKKLERDVAHLASFPVQNPYPVLEVESGGAVFFVNAAATAALARLGLDPDPRQFLPGTPEELVLLRSQCEQGPQTRELRLGEATFLRVVTAPPGQSSLLRVYAIDITELRRAEGALAESEKNLRTLFETMSEGIVYEGHDGSIISANPAAERLLGLSLDEMQGRTSLDPRWKATHEDGSPFPGEAHSLRVAAMTGKPGRDEIMGIYNPKSDTYVWLSVNSTPEFLPGEKEPFRAYAVFRDITERRRTDEEIRALNAELEERVRRRTAELEAANKELEAFSYSVSHDLRAPLRSIDGFSQAVIEGSEGALPEAARDDLERVRRATQHMGQLIDDMLLLARVTRAEMHIQPVDMTALASDAADEIARDNPGRAVQLDIEPGMTATGDSRLLRIVYVNLLSNAWKFTSKHGHAHVAVGTTEDPEHGHAFFVRDDGAGFDPRYKDRLFAAFQRLHSLEEFPGTGIGLATVRRIVHRHVGVTWADGGVGCGATFYFTLPDSSALQSAKEEQS